MFAGFSMSSPTTVITDLATRGVFFAASLGEAISERLMVFGAQNATAAFARVLLDDMVSNLVHQDIKKNKVVQCVIGPLDARLRSISDALHHSSGRTQSTCRLIGQNTGERPWWWMQGEQADFAGNQKRPKAEQV